MTRSKVRKQENKNITAERIRFQRNKCSMSQKQLADTIGVSKTTISNIENQVQNDISEEFLKKMAEALNCSTDYLKGFVSEPNSVLSTVPIDVDSRLKNLCEGISHYCSPESFPRQEHLFFILNLYNYLVSYSPNLVSGSFEENKSAFISDLDIQKNADIDAREKKKKLLNLSILDTAICIMQCLEDNKSVLTRPLRLYSSTNSLTEKIWKKINELDNNQKISLLTLLDCIFASNQQQLKTIKSLCEAVVPAHPSNSNVSYKKTSDYIYDKLCNEIIPNITSDACDKLFSDAKYVHPLSYTDVQNNQFKSLLNQYLGDFQKEVKQNFSIKLGKVCKLQRLESDGQCNQLKRIIEVSFDDFSEILIFKLNQKLDNEQILHELIEHEYPKITPDQLHKFINQQWTSKSNLYAKQIMDDLYKHIKNTLNNTSTSINTYSFHIEFRNSLQNFWNNEANKYINTILKDIYSPLSDKKELPE